MSGFRYLPVLESGEAADPAAFVVGVPSGVWKVGDTFTPASEHTFRILENLGPPESEAPEADEWNGVFVVEPL